MAEKFDEKIKLLIEQRVIQATKNQTTVKLYNIAKYLGKPIISQSIFNDAPQEDPIFYDGNKIDVRDPDDWNTIEYGMYFDGLKYGVNLCITALIYDGKLDELKATYNGYLVYAESEGELKAYAPFPSWERPVDMFYEAAIQAEKEKAKQEQIQRRETNRKKMSDFWKKFKSLWGF